MTRNRPRRAARRLRPARRTRSAAAHPPRGADQAAGGRRRGRTRWQRAAAIVLLGLLIAVGAAVGGAAALWHHQGGRWFVVASPSMGSAAPVGSLLITRPTTVTDVADGTFITFRSPGSGKVFSHRATAHTPTGLTTRGDVNLADDPWTITDDQLIGRVVTHVPALGWALRALPIFACGLGLTWLVTAWVRQPRRYTLRLAGISVTTAVAGWILHPWVGLERLAVTTPNDGGPGVLMQVVSTGLLPIRVTSHHAALHDGDVATLHLTHLEHGRYPVDAHLAFTWWQWVLLALIVLSPLLWTTIRGLPPVLPDAVQTPPTPDGDGEPPTSDTPSPAATTGASAEAVRAPATV